MTSGCQRLGGERAKEGVWQLAANEDKKLLGIKNTSYLEYGVK